MKYIVALLTVCCLSLNCLGADDELKGVITSVQNSSAETKAGEKVERFTINTHQVGGKFAGTVRVAVEMTDKDGKIAWGEVKGSSQTGEVEWGQFKGASFSGAVRWIFEAKHGDLNRPKVTGYVVQYGYRQGKEFVCLDEKCYRTKSRDELVERNKTSGALAVRCASRTSEVE